MLYNGLFAFGGPFAVCLAHDAGSRGLESWDMANRLLVFLSAHGALELTAMVIAGGAGAMTGLALLFPGQRTRWTAFRHRGRDALTLLMGCLPLLMMAGLVEGVVSLNPSAGLPIRLLLLASSMLFLGLYLGGGGSMVRHET